MWRILIVAIFAALTTGRKPKRLKRKPAKGKNSRAGGRYVPLFMKLTQTMCAEPDPEKCDKKDKCIYLKEGKCAQKGCGIDADRAIPCTKSKCCKTNTETPGTDYFGKCYYIGGECLKFNREPVDDCDVLIATGQPHTKKATCESVKPEGKCTWTVEDKCEFTKDLPDPTCEKESDGSLHKQGECDTVLGGTCTWTSDLTCVETSSLPDATCERTAAGFEHTQQSCNAVDGCIFMHGCKSIVEATCYQQPNGNPHTQQTCDALDECAWGAGECKIAVDITCDHQANGEPHSKETCIIIPGCKFQDGVCSEREPETCGTLDDGNKRPKESCDVTPFCVFLKGECIDEKFKPNCDNRVVVDNEGHDIQKLHTRATCEALDGCLWWKGKCYYDTWGKDTCEHPRHPNTHYNKETCEAVEPVGFCVFRKVDGEWKCLDLDNAFDNCDIKINGKPHERKSSCDKLPECVWAYDMCQHKDHILRDTCAGRVNGEEHTKRSCTLLVMPDDPTERMCTWNGREGTCNWIKVPPPEADLAEI